MIKLFISYIIISTISSCVFAYIFYKDKCSYMSVDEFIKRKVLPLPPTFIIGLLWPITLIVIVIWCFMYFSYAPIMKILDKIFGRKKK